MKFPTSANKKHHCKECGHTPLTIYALVYEPNQAEPTLICERCGKFYDITEYNLTGKMVANGQ